VITYAEAHTLDEMAAEFHGKAKPPRPLQSLDLDALASRKATPRGFTIDHYAPSRELTLFTGSGGVGKSLFGQQMATASAAALGRCLELRVADCPALYITCEDCPEELHYRQETICDALGVPMASLEGRLHLVSLRGELGNELATFARDGAMEVAPAYERLRAKITATSAGVVWLDNVAHFFVGDENSRAQVTQFANLLNRLASQTGAAIILLGHPPKSGATFSGSTAWINAVRSQFSIDWLTEGKDKTVTDRNARVIRSEKANYARTGKALRFRWHGGAFVLDSDVPRAAFDEMLADTDNQVFLACLRARNEQGEGRLVGPAPGPNYAPSQFEGMPEAKGRKRADLKRAMERLFASKQIETHSYRNTSKGRDVTVIRETIPETPNATPEPCPNTDTELPLTIHPNAPAHTLVTKVMEAGHTDAPAPNFEIGPNAASASGSKPCTSCDGVGCGWCEK
jgi:RecA-family ATPase